MAQTDNTAEPKTGEGDDSDLLKLAAKRWEASLNRERENIERAYADLRLLAGDDEEHWGPGVKAEREGQGRPCFTVNKLTQYVEQVTGDQRQMRPAMRVVPVDSRASEDVAKTISGMLRYIEHRSAAAAVYNRAAESQVACGVGAWRVVTEYAADSTFEQELGVADVDDPVMVLFDPDATKLSRSDAMFCHVPVDLSRDAFEAKYPGKTPADFGDKNGYGFSRDWSGDDYIRVTEYWYKEPTKKLLALLPDGGVDDLTDEKDPAKLARLKAEGARIEKRDAFCVYRAVLSCDQVLEPPTKWPGRYIPIIPVLGKERRIGRRVVREGAVRHARDAQRIKNYGITAQVEVTALQPKAPYIGTEVMFENHQADWEAANVENRPYLAYTPDPAAPGASPKREPPPVASSAIQAITVQADADIEGTIGIYKSSIGAESNEKSGKAILAREKQGDTSTYVYIQNLTEAVAHTARVIIDLIPHVYDTERTVRVIGVDGKENLVQINQPAGLEMDRQPGDRLQDVTVGAYDVVVESGPSYATKREEAREGMVGFLQALPDAGPRVADLIAKAQDWPMADEFAKRLMPPDVAQQEAAQNGEGPPPPDPAMVQQHIAEQVQGAQQQIAAEKQQVEAQLALKEQAIELAKREVAMQAKEVAMQGKAVQEQAAAAQQARADTEAKGQELAQAFAGIQEMPAVIVQALAPAIQQQSEQIAQLTEAMGQLLAIAQAPTVIQRHPETGQVLGAQKRLN